MNNKILVVEDSADVLGLIQMLLNSEGYQAAGAANGKVALDTLRLMEEPPSLMFLDLMMPVMDGLEFLKEVEKDEKLSSIPVVVMSAYRKDEVRQMGLGERPLLMKPVDADELVMLAERYCKSSRLS